MAYVLHSHLIHDASTNLSYNDSAQLISARIDRAYYVDNIDDMAGSGEVINAAIAHVQGVVTVGSAHPSVAQALATDYRGVPWDSATGAKVIVTFSYEMDNIPTTYQVEAFASLQSVLSNHYYDEDNNPAPILIDYWPEWKNPEAPTATAVGTGYKAPGQINVLRPIGGFHITKTISSSEADALEAAMDTYVGTTNEGTFRGRAANTVLCTNVGTSAAPYNGQYIGRLSFAVKPEGWDEYVRVTNTQFGTPSNIWPAGKNSAGTAVVANGMAKLKVYKRTNFTTLLGLL